MDNLSTGFKRLVHEKALLIEGDYSDLNLLSHIFRNYNFNAVIHCAGDLIIEESVKNPHKYYYNNTFKILQFVNFIS